MNLLQLKTLVRNLESKHNPNAKARKIFNRFATGSGRNAKSFVDNRTVSKIRACFSLEGGMMISQLDRLQSALEAAAVKGPIEPIDPSYILISHRSAATIFTMGQMIYAIGKKVHGSEDGWELQTLKSFRTAPDEKLRKEIEAKYLGGPEIRNLKKLENANFLRMFGQELATMGASEGLMRILASMLKKYLAALRDHNSKFLLEIPLNEIDKIETLENLPALFPGRLPCIFAVIDLFAPAIHNEVDGQMTARGVAVVLVNSFGYPTIDKDTPMMEALQITQTQEKSGETLLQKVANALHPFESEIKRILEGMFKEEMPEFWQQLVLRYKEKFASSPKTTEPQIEGYNACRFKYSRQCTTAPSCEWKDRRCMPKGIDVAGVMDLFTEQPMFRWSWEDGWVYSSWMTVEKMVEDINSYNTLERNIKVQYNNVFGIEHIKTEFTGPQVVVLKEIEDMFQVTTR